MENEGIRLFPLCLPVVCLGRLDDYTVFFQICLFPNLFFSNYFKKTICHFPNLFFSNLFFSKSVFFQWYLLVARTIALTRLVWDSHLDSHWDSHWPHEWVNWFLFTEEELSCIVCERIFFTTKELERHQYRKRHWG